VSSGSVAIVKLFMGAIAIGLAPIFVKQLVKEGDISPLTAGFWRMAIGSVGFFVMLTIASGRSQLFRPIRFDFFDIDSKCWGLVVIAGVMFAFDLAAWHTSFNYTSVASSTLIANMSAVLVPLSGVLFFKERPGKNLYLGGALALIGVVGLTQFKFLAHQSSYTESLAWGEGLALLTAFFYTGYMLAIKRLTQRIMPLKAMAFSSGVSAVILLAIHLFFGGWLFPISREGWLHLLALGVISQILGQGLIASALTTLPVSVSALLLLSAPSSTAVFGWIILGEVITIGQIVSIIITLTGIGIVALR
jgi:drug/metabolite transporter (DMT)-like permease